MSAVSAAHGTEDPRGQRRRRRCQLPVLAAVLLLAAPGPARAQPAGASQAKADEARRLFSEGVAAAKASRWEEARDRFERSYRASPGPLTLFNLAGAQRNTGQLVAAGESYRLFLRQTHSGRHDAFRRAAERELAELERITPVVRIRAPGAAGSDEIALDGDVVSAGTAEEGISVDPGDHVAAVRRSGRVAAQRKFQIAPAERLAIDLRVPAPPPDRGDGAADREILTTAPVPPPSRSAGEGGLLRSPWFWVAAGAVLVTGAGAAGYYVYDSNRGSAREPTPGTFGTIEIP